jgi:hypothetical protein
MKSKMTENNSRGGAARSAARNSHAPVVTNMARGTKGAARIVVRPRVPKAGDVVRVERCHGGEALPSDLTEGTVVTVLRAENGFADLVDENGRVWKLPFSNIEAPCSLWWCSQWIDRMTHPDGEAAWNAFLQQSSEDAKRVRVRRKPDAEDTATAE